MRRSVPLRQTAAFSVLFLSGSNLLLGGSFYAGRDAWASLLITVGLMFLWARVLARLSVTRPEETVFDLLSLLPKPLSALFGVLLIVYCVDQCVVILGGYAFFARLISLPRTPVVWMLTLSCLILYALLRREDRILYRFSYVIALPILFSAAAMFLMQIPMFRGENLLPILYGNTKEIFQGAWNAAAYPFGNAFLLLGTVAFPHDEKKAKAYYRAVIGISGALSALVLMQCLLLLGGDLAASVHYPYDFAASLIRIGDFFSRIEAFAALLFYTSAIPRVVWLSRLALKGVARFVSVGAEQLSFPFCVFLCGYACVAFSNVDAIFDYLRVAPYFYPVLQFGLPAVLFILAERKSDGRSRPAVLRKHLDEP